MRITKSTPPRYPTTASFLSTETRERGSDPPIPIERAGEVWKDFAPVAERSVIATLRNLPLYPLTEQLRRAGVRVLRSHSGVRKQLAWDRELIRDLTQDVGLAMIQAIHRGAINAARPVVYTWVTRAACWLTREKSRSAAVALLTGAPLSEDEGDEESKTPEPPPTAGITGRPLALAEELEDVLDLRTRLRTVLFHAVPANLTDAQELVFTRWVEGASTAEIARELGITEGAVRLRLMHARKRLAA